MNLDVLSFLLIDTIIPDCADDIKLVFPPVISRLTIGRLIIAAFQESEMSPQNKDLSVYLCRRNGYNSANAVVLKQRINKRSDGRTA